MSKQRRLEELSKLITVCRERGITSRTLRQVVFEICTAGCWREEPEYDWKWRKADVISKAGVAAQLSYLREVWGLKKLEAFLMKSGGVLDALVRVSSSSPEDLEKDEGLDNIDEDGDVLDDDDFDDDYGLDDYLDD